MLFIRTKFGRHAFDKFKLKMPVLGPVVSKVAISRFTRTLGTLVSSGVPILQALTIVKETAGNVIVANAVGAVHESVKEGETITAPLEASGVFPPMVISMVDVGEQTGALPEMLLKIADNYDDEVDNAVAAMTSLLEPIMIVFLAVIVGSIVIAMFLPLIELMNRVGSEAAARATRAIRIRPISRAPGHPPGLAGATDRRSAAEFAAGTEYRRTGGSRYPGSLRRSFGLAQPECRSHGIAERRMPVRRGLQRIHSR